MIRYIYEITNNVNGKTYIGQHTTDNENDGYMGSGVILKQAQSKYGIKNFSKKILCYCDNQDELNEKEIELIKNNRAKGKAEYNIADGGGGFCQQESFNYLKTLIDSDPLIDTIDDLLQVVCGLKLPNLGRVLMKYKRYFIHYLSAKRVRKRIAETEDVWHLMFSIELED